MPLFIEIIIVGSIVYFLSLPVIRTIDLYNELKDEEAKRKHISQTVYDDFDFDWLEEIIREEWEKER